MQSTFLYTIILKMLPSQRNTAHLHNTQKLTKMQQEKSYKRHSDPLTLHELQDYEEYPLNQHIISEPRAPLSQVSNTAGEPSTTHSHQQPEILYSQASFSFSQESELPDFSSEITLEHEKEQYLDDSNDKNQVQDDQAIYRDIPSMDEKGKNNKADNKYRKKKKNRKIRTTITRQKLAAMNQIFGEYTKHKEEGKNPRLNLKEIGNQLSLGYSTILHKFREYRSHKMVKGGALIASLQKKRKYKKSKQIEQIIKRALQSGPFYTAVQLSDYIFRVQNKKYSRSIISRHLGEMGYSYKNLKSSPIQKNKPIYRETRRVYANIIYPFLKQKNTVTLYLDELACSVATFQRRRINLTPKEMFNQNPEDYVSLVIGASSQGIVEHNIKRGFYTQEEFVNILQQCLDKIINRAQNQQIQLQRIIVITDMNKIHLDPTGVSQNMKPIKNLLKRYNAKRYYLPPSSPHLNPIESMFANLKSKLFKKQIQGPVQLQRHLSKCTDDIKNESVDVYFQDMQKCLKQAKQEQTKYDQNSNQQSSHSCDLNK